MYSQAVIPLEVVRDPYLTADQIRVLIALYQWWGALKIDPVSDIAEDINMPPERVQAAIDGMVPLGWILPVEKDVYRLMVPPRVNVDGTDLCEHGVCYA